MDWKASPLCNECQRKTEACYHNFGKCKLMKRFWGTISQELSGIFRVRVKKDSSLFLLDLPSKLVTLTHLQFKLCDKLLLLARKRILINWIKDQPPTASLW